MMLSNSTHQQICLNASWMCLIYTLSRRAAVNDGMPCSGRRRSLSKQANRGVTSTARPVSRAAPSHNGSRGLGQSGGGR